MELWGRPACSFPIPATHFQRYDFMLIGVVFKMKSMAVRIYLYMDDGVVFFLSFFPFYDRIMFPQFSTTSVLTWLWMVAQSTWACGTLQVSVQYYSCIIWISATSPSCSGHENEVWGTYFKYFWALQDRKITTG